MGRSISPCDSCQDKTCLVSGKPCKAASVLLPPMTRGKMIGRKNVIELSAIERDVGALDKLSLARDCRAGHIEQTRGALDHLKLAERKQGTPLPTGKARRIIEAFFWHGRTRKDIAESMGVHVNTVTRVLNRARRGCISTKT